MAIFDDLLTSSRGPGVIGTVLGLFVLLGFGLLFLMVTDDRFMGWKQDPAQEIRRQEERIGELHEWIEQTKVEREEQAARSRLADEFQAVSIQAGALQPRIEEMRRNKQAASEAISAVAAEWDRYRESYRAAARAAAKGEKYDKLELQGGRTLEQVEVIGVDAVRMQVRHSGGISGIDWKELPAAMQDRFQFDTVETGKLLDDEGADHRFRDLTHKITRLREQIGRKQQAVAAAQARQRQAAARVETLERQRMLMPERIAAKQGELVLEQQKRVRNTERVTAELREIENAFAALPGRIAEAQAEARQAEHEKQKIEEEVAELARQLGELNQQLATAKAKADAEPAAGSPDGAQPPAE